MCVFFALQSSIEEHRVLQSISKHLANGQANDVMGQQLIDGHDTHLVCEGDRNLTIPDGSCDVIESSSHPFSITYARYVNYDG